MSDSEICKIKSDIRRNLLELRGRIPAAERAKASEIICRRIRETEEYRAAKTLLLYRAVKSEVSLALLGCYAAEDGKTIAWPLCTGPGIMEARVPNSPEAFCQGSYEIPEPDPQYSRLVLPEEIDLVVCPCAGVTRDGIRLGMGAGYYDRYLPKCRKAAVFCAAFTSQLAEQLPREAWDRVMDRVFTEE